MSRDERSSPANSGVYALVRLVQCLDAMVNLSEIKPGMPVVCSENGQFAVVDHTEGDASIKLRRDQAGQHHYIPVNWVTKVDDKVHIDRPGKQAMREWSSAPAQA
jgi:hypothetical protein